MDTSFIKKLSDDQILKRIRQCQQMISHNLDRGFDDAVYSLECLLAALEEEKIERFMKTKDMQSRKMKKRNKKSGVSPVGNNGSIEFGSIDEVPPYE